MFKESKMMSVFTLAIIVMSLFAGMAAANVVPTVDLGIDYLRIDGEKYIENGVDLGDVLTVRRGQELPIKMRISAPNGVDVEGVQISADIVYDYDVYEYDDVHASTRTFDIDAGTTETKSLDLKVPVKIDAEDVLMHVTVRAKNAASYTYTFNLHVKGTEREDAVIIKEAYLSPSNEVLPGRAVSALVKVENIGDRDMDDVTLTVAVPGLNIQDVETLDELDEDDSETFESIILRFPKDAQPGQYKVIYTVKFDEYESTTTTDMITVLGTPADNEVEQKTMITVPEAQSVTPGNAGSVYPVVIANLGKEAKAYQIGVSGVETWGTARVDPSANVIVAAGNTATVFIYVSANEDVQAGQKVFKVSINDGTEAKEIPLTANVTEKEASNWGGMQKTLEIGLVVLVIILIIIGLIVGFNKLRGSDDEDEDEDAKTYY